MIDIIDVATAITEHSSGNVYFDYLKRTFVYSKTTKDNYLPLFKLPKDVLMSEIDLFISDHFYEFSNYDFNNGSFTVFKKYIKNNNLFDEWINHLAKAISFETYYWCQCYNLEEDEATPKQYKEITKLVSKLRSYNLHEKIGSNVLFNINYDYDPISFILLGNQGITKGISFLLDQTGEDYFLDINSAEEMNIDVATFSSLLNCVNFYYDGDDDFEEHFGMENPFGRGNNIGSIHILQGNQSYSKLSKSLANLSIKYLENATRFLKDFIKTPSFKKINFYDLFRVDCALNITSDKTKFQVTKIIEQPTGFAFSPKLDFLRPLKNIEIIKGSCDFIFRKMTDYLNDPDDLRTMHFAYAIFIVDHETGEPIDFYLGQPNLYRPLTSFVDAYEKEDKKMLVCKKIVTNNPYDFEFASTLFKPYMESGKINLELEDNRLKADDVFEDFCNKLAETEPEYDA